MYLFNLGVLCSLKTKLWGQRKNRHDCDFRCDIIVDSSTTLSRLSGSIQALTENKHSTMSGEMYKIDLQVQCV